MKLVGVLLALAGWIIPVIALTFTRSTGALMFLCILGLAISLTGILGVLNKAHQKEAIWRR
ncbi:MAG TPA: hypothetical protein VGF06_18260 [Terriglobales bacterium]|jgi:hypothetical protein